MTILTSEQQVLDLAGPGVLVLWRVYVPFKDRPDSKRLTTELYHRGDFGAIRWTRYDPEDRFARDFQYLNKDIWAIAGRPGMETVVSVADGTHRVASDSELFDLPRLTVVSAGDNVYQNFGGEWWQMDPWSNPEDDTLSPEFLWDWHGSDGDGIVILWHPAETGVTRAIRRA